MRFLRWLGGFFDTTQPQSMSWLCAFLLTLAILLISAGMVFGHNRLEAAGAITAIAGAIAYFVGKGRNDGPHGGADG